MFIETVRKELRSKHIFEKDITFIVSVHVACVYIKAVVTLL